MNNSCGCNLGSAYCFDVYGCVTAGMEIIVDIADPVNVMFEDHFGGVYRVDGVIPVNGVATINPSDLPEGMLNPYSENLLMYVETVAGAPVTLSIDGDSYDAVLLKFHPGTEVTPLIIQ